MERLAATGTPEIAEGQEIGWDQDPRASSSDHTMSICRWVDLRKLKDGYQTTTIEQVLHIEAQGFKCGKVGSMRCEV
jgi:hypothetical protein